MSKASGTNKFAQDAPILLDRRAKSTRVAVNESMLLPPAPPNIARSHSIGLITTHPLEPRIQELYHRYQPQSQAAPSAPEHEVPVGTSMHISFPPRRRTLSGRPAVSSAQPRLLFERTGQGYRITRTPASISVHIDPDAFFGMHPQPGSSGSSQGKSPSAPSSSTSRAQSASKSRSNTPQPAAQESRPNSAAARAASALLEKDEMILHLKERVEELNLFVEEEKLSHKETKLKARQDLDNTADQLKFIHRKEIESTVARHAEETKRVRGEHEQQMELTRTEHEAQVSELNNALDQMRASFETFREQLIADATAQRDADVLRVRNEMQAECQQLVDHINESWNEKFEKERESVEKEFEGKLQNIQVDHQLEIEDYYNCIEQGIHKSYEDTAILMRKYRALTDELKSVNASYEELRHQYDECGGQLQRLEGELLDTREKLQRSEATLDQRVRDAEAKYEARMNQLVEQNNDLRESLNIKSSEVFFKKQELDHIFAQRANDAKETMGEVLRSRMRNNLPLVNTNFSVPSSPANSSKRESPAAGEEEIAGQRPADPPNEERDQTVPSAQPNADAAATTPLQRPEDAFTGIMQEGGVHVLAGWSAAAEAGAVERAAELHFGAARGDPAFVSGVLTNAQTAMGGRRAGIKTTAAGGRRRVHTERSLSAPTTFTEQKRAFITIDFLQKERNKAIMKKWK